MDFLCSVIPALRIRMSKETAVILMALFILFSLGAICYYGYKMFINRMIIRKGEAITAECLQAVKVPGMLRGHFNYKVQLECNFKCESRIFEVFISEADFLQLIANNKKMIVYNYYKKPDKIVVSRDKRLSTNLIIALLTIVFAIIAIALILFL